ncbi:NfeD family protein [Methylocystis echinoides]|uniref:NfeD family protein n=1 Tax=Methylocystis echinoides TaxID=29468 RepID=UPI003445CD30
MTAIDIDASLLADPATLSLIAGLALLAFDILVVGLSPIMFVAVGALVTSATLFATGARPGLLETAAIASVLSLLIALLGRKPLQRFQAADVQEDQSSDLIGRDLVTTHEVTKATGRVHWSGLDWEARLSADAAVDRLMPGVRARVVRVDNLVLVLAPIA